MIFPRHKNLDDRKYSQFNFIVHIVYINSKIFKHTPLSNYKIIVFRPLDAIRYLINNKNMETKKLKNCIDIEFLKRN